MKRLIDMGALALGLTPLVMAAVSPAQAAPMLSVPAITARDAVREEGATARLLHPIDAAALPAAPSTAWIGALDRELIVEFEVAGSPASVSPAARDDLEMFEGPAVEIFLGSAEDASHGYYHVALNPRGAIYDEAVRDGGWTRDPAWDAPLSVEVLESGSPETWSVRLGFPLAILRRPLPDAPPRPALDREMWLQLAAVSMPEGAPAQAVTWSPAVGSFHAPSHFGRMRFEAGPPLFEAAVETALSRQDGTVSARVSLLGSPEEGSMFIAASHLRRLEGEEIRVPLFEQRLDAGNPAFERQLTQEETTHARYFVTRLTGEDGILRDQLVQDWFYQEEAPVLVIHERFRDSLRIRLLERPAHTPLEVRIVSTQEDGEAVWEAAHAGEERLLNIDTTDWTPGTYELQYTEEGESHSVPLAKLSPSTPGVPDGWAFWGYMPDEELLAEFHAFASLAGGQEKLAGYIYGGSIDPVTGAMSAFELDSLLAWRASLPEAELHLMIDGQGNFDLLPDDQVDAMARRIVEELMPEEGVTGIHFDLEPYRASQVRLTRALTKHGWTKPLSIATGLATTIPPEQWASIDYMVVMNYDLGKTPEIFTERASQNARAFARAARNHDRSILLGLPVIATHNEYAMMVEAESGEIVEGSPEANMLPFVNPALDIYLELRADPDLEDAIGAPVLWGALARGHHVGMRRYRYFPTSIEGEVWTRLLQFHEEAVAR